MNASNSSPGRLWPLSICLSLGAAWTLGCGGAEATLTGIVTLDNAPLPEGSVRFIPVEGGQVASAAIESDGSYAARTSGAEGIAVGKYAVTVRAFQPGTPDPRGGPPMPGKLITPPRYLQSRTSGITVQVEPGSQEFPIELSSQ